MQTLIAENHWPVDDSENFKEKFCALLNWPPEDENNSDLIQTKAIYLHDAYVEVHPDRGDDDKLIKSEKPKPSVPDVAERLRVFEQKTRQAKVSVSNEKSWPGYDIVVREKSI